MFCKGHIYFDPEYQGCVASWSMLEDCIPFQSCKTNMHFCKHLLARGLPLLSLWCLCNKKCKHPTVCLNLHHKLVRASSLKMRASKVYIFKDGGNDTGALHSFAANKIEWLKVCQIDMKCAAGAKVSRQPQQGLETFTHPL